MPREVMDSERNKKDKIQSVYIHFLGISTIAFARDVVLL